MTFNEVVNDKLNKLEREYTDLCDRHPSTDPLIMRIAFYNAAILIAEANPVDDYRAQTKIVHYLEHVKHVSVTQLVTRLKDKINY